MIGVYVSGRSAPAPLNPYPEVHGGSRVGATIPGSPDPYSNYVWDLDGLDDPFAYQMYVDLPIGATGLPASSFSGIDAMRTGGSVSVHGPGLLTVKFAQEAACWVEFDSNQLDSSGGALDISISENILPGENYRVTPARYGQTYRVETNNQLYEGIRYAIVNVTTVGSGGWSLTKFRRKCQVVPTNYKGRFSSSDPLLDQVVSLPPHC